MVVSAAYLDDEHASVIRVEVGSEVVPIVKVRPASREDGRITHLAMSCSIAGLILAAFPLECRPLPEGR